MRSGLVTPLYCLVLNRLKLTSLFFMFRCLGFCFLSLIFVFFAFTCYKGGLKKKKPVLKSDPLFAVNLVVHQCLKNQNRWWPLFQHHLLCYLHECWGKIYFCKYNAPGFLLCFVMLFFNNEYDFLISSKVGLNHLTFALAHF